MSCMFVCFNIIFYLNSRIFTWRAPSDIIWSCMKKQTVHKSYRFFSQDTPDLYLVRVDSFSELVKAHKNQFSAVLPFSVVHSLQLLSKKTNARLWYSPQSFNHLLSD